MLCCKTNLIFMQNKKDMLQQCISELGLASTRRIQNVIITKIIRYLLTALATSHHTDRLSFTMLLFF